MKAPISVTPTWPFAYHSAMQWTGDNEEDIKRWIGADFTTILDGHVVRAPEDATAVVTWDPWEPQFISEGDWIVLTIIASTVHRIAAGNRAWFHEAYEVGEG